MHRRTFLVSQSGPRAVTPRILRSGGMCSRHVLGLSNLDDRLEARRLFWSHWLNAIEQFFRAQDENL